MDVRTPTPDDAEALFDLVAASDLDELGEVDYELADAVEELTRPGLDPARDAWAVPEGDRLVGYASTHARSDAPQIQVQLCVHPSAADGVYAELLRRIRARTAQYATSRAVPVMASAFAPAAPASRAAARLRADGWRPVRRFSRMRIEVGPENGAAPPLPPGVAMHRGVDADESAVHAVMMQSFADHFQHAAEPFEQWRTRQHARAGYDRELWWLAEVDGHPAGALIGTRMAEQGWVAMLGVCRAYRRRGLGQLLLQTAFASFAELGYRRVELGVDTEGTTGAYRLYTSVGMTPAMAHDCYQIEIPPSLPA